MGYQITLAVTGGGSRVIPLLLARCGASQTIVEVSVPYHPAALREYVGGRVDRACSEATALRLAVAAYQRGRRYIAAEHRESGGAGTGSEREIAGVGCTAALATDRVRRGRDRVFVAVHTCNRSLTFAADFGHAESDRDAQEAWAAELIASAVRKLEIPVGSISEPAFPVVQREQAAPQSWADLAEGKIAAVGIENGEEYVWSGPPVLPAQVVFPGSFDPLHEGHLQMAEIAAKRFGKAVRFELSIANADKPPLDYLTIADRVEQFARRGLPLLLTRSPRFDQKAALFPESIFLIGADTAIRLADPRFYENDSGHRDAALQRIAEAGCRFLLFGRRLESGFADPRSLELPRVIRELCEAVPPTEFRNDVSSTELRRQEEE